MTKSLEQKHLIDIFTKFCEENDIVIKKLDKLNNRTMIEFNCVSCKTPIKKSYKVLNKYDKLQSHNFLCSKCFRLSFY